uniref:RNA polymerase alpha subunit C-terminal domain-containing protein n=1 Tax=Mycena chlorophos TaxID=658473 RepID=A0ABQ0LTQ1_MYCCL|nr:predicted protein [Mycena chlorophos]
MRITRRGGDTLLLPSASNVSSELSTGGTRGYKPRKTRRFTPVLATGCADIYKHLYNELTFACLGLTDLFQRLSRGQGTFGVVEDGPVPPAGNILVNRTAHDAGGIVGHFAPQGDTVLEANLKQGRPGKQEGSNTDTRVRVLLTVHLSTAADYDKLIRLRRMTVADLCDRYYVSPEIKEVLDKHGVRNVRGLLEVSARELQGMGCTRDDMQEIKQALEQFFEENGLETRS